MSDSADALVGYVKDHSRDLGESVVDAIKKYPVPTALIGIGIGWLLMERMTGSGDSGHNYDSQPYRGSAYGNGGANYRSQSYGGRSGYESQSYGGAQSVPVYDQYGRRQDNSGIRYSYASQEAGGQGFYRGPQSSSYSGYEQDRSQSSGAQGMLENAQEAVGQIGDKVKQGVQGVQDVAARVGNTVQEFASDIRDRGEHLAEQAQHYGSNAQHLGSQAQQYGSQAQYQMRQTGHQVQESIETHPLVFGAVALAVGAAVGMMLPSTRREDEMFGQWRDEVVNRAQEVAGDVRQRAQQVVEEVKPELQQTVEKVKQDLTQTSKSAMQDLQQTGKTALQDIRQTASTAEAVAKEGAKPQTSGKPQIANGNTQPANSSQNKPTP
jgi:ElaB/YqjD/DUF883 family membrane-anchored ribosome-binding protein